MKSLQTGLMTTFIVLTLIVLGGTIFAVIVEYPNWFANVPQSIEATRNFYRVFHPGYFFQIFAPLAVLSAIATALANWRIAPVRNLVLVTLALFVAAELLTFFYIYPRLAILFVWGGQTPTVEALKQAAAEFTFADRIRTGLGVLGSLSAVASLVKFIGSRERLA